ncbi:MAG: NAD-dependent epimerase/dehydratase family protein, partial [SAR324 cluster bacterium]|nr:NAD-dependent epimerase/dehydratase family protein [SAR324 cluster bacterium]
MIGTALCQRFEKNSISHLQLSRNPSGSSKKMVYWNPEEQVLENEKLGEVDTVIHLAGENVGKRWTHNIREKILSSRKDSSRFLFEKLATHDPPPKTLIASSAIGIYGYNNSTQFDEDSPRGKGFLADVVEAWEESAQPLK